MIRIELERPTPVNPERQDWASYVRFTLGEWCWTNIGEGNIYYDSDEDNIQGLFDAGLTWCVKIWYGYAHFYFNRPEDAVMFKLKWS